jgi:rhodanese-related sulfurtransferase
VKFIVENWLLIAIAFTSGGLLLWPFVWRGARSGSLSASEAVRLLNREKGIVIDVSEPEEFAQGHVAGARNVPLGSLDGAKNLPTNKALPLVVVCPTGARANRAAGILRKLGFANASALGGGLASWRQANLPIEKSA